MYILYFKFPISNILHLRNAIYLFIYSFIHSLIHTSIKYLLNIFQMLQQIREQNMSLEFRLLSLINKLL